jgi:polar amino acid transport system substrate-binding protein
MMRATSRAVAAFAGLALALTACGDGDGTAGEEPEGPDEVAVEELDLVQAGSLSVCSDVPYPPFEFEDPEAPSGYSGFDIDLVQEIADRLGLDLVVQEVGFDGLQSGATLAAGQCDLAASAMTITERRAENLEFSEPYFDATQSLIVLSDSGIASLEDLEGGQLGVQAGTTGAEYAEDNAPEGTEIVEFGSGPDLFTAMTAGQIDAGLQDLPVNVEQAERDDAFDIVDEYDTGEQYGFAAALGNTELIDAVDAALAEMRDDGTYDAIYDQYFAVDR